MINLRVRFKNPVFWVEILLAILSPILIYFGIAMQDITSWPTLGHLLLDAIKNPFLVGTIVVSVWNAINDPTTAGVTDTKLARTYVKPSNDK